MPVSEEKYTKLLKSALVVSLHLTIFALSHPVGAEDISADLELAWKVSFRGKDVGYSLTMLSFLEDGSEYFLHEEGRKVLSGNIALIKIEYKEKTSTLWDETGIMHSFTSVRDINGVPEIREAFRNDDGSLTWRLRKGGTVHEKTIDKDQYDYTGRDLYLKNVFERLEPVTYRVLSVNDGKIYKITYRYLGGEDIEGTHGKITCARVEIKGPLGEGIFLVNELGYPVSFTTKFFLGSFSFRPVNLDEAKRAIFRTIPATSEGIQ
jgi:hypothetical protein